MMETFTEPNKLVSNPDFIEQKENSLDSLVISTIDSPILDIIGCLNELSFCFTLQCCYGHFLYNGQNDPNNLESLPIINTSIKVKYRIAYIALCIDNSDLGIRFIESLKDITLLDPDNIQFCSAAWFWERQINSYALQVEPERFKNQDTAMLDYQEALYIDELRNKFFLRIKDFFC